MLYSPSDPDLGLWDTWIFPAGDTFHLFFLQRIKTEMGCSTIGHAVSSDLVYWEPRTDIAAQGTAGEWDAGPLMTGMVVEREGRYSMFYGSMVDGVQRIGVMLSDDLEHWQKYPDNPILEPQGPWYETDPLASPSQEVAWRDPCIVWDGKTAVYYAFFCARLPQAPPGGGGCIGLGRSTDLLHWEVLPPLYVSDQYFAMEVPDVFRMNGRAYLLFSTCYWFGTRYSSSDPYQMNGIHYLVSDRLLGGYVRPRLLLGSRAERLDNYVGRTFLHQGRRLFYYHNSHPADFTQPRHGSLASVKELVTTQGGGLQVRYHPALERHAGPNRRGMLEGACPLMGEWSLDEGSVRGACSPGTGGFLLNAELSNGIVTVRLTIHEGRGAGILFSYDHEMRTGLGCFLDQQRGTVDLVQVGPAFGGPISLLLLESRGYKVARGQPTACRIVVKGRYVDLYVQDELLISYVLDRPAVGRLGMVVDNGTAVFDAFEVRDLDICNP